MGIKMQEKKIKVLQEQEIIIKDFFVSDELDDEEGVSFRYTDKQGKRSGDLTSFEDLKDIPEGTKVEVYGNCESGYRACYIGYFIFKRVK